MKTVLKIWLILLAVTFSSFLAQASELPSHGTPIDEKSQGSELAENILAIQLQIKEMNSMQDMLANVEDTNGLLSAIGQTITQAELSLANIRKNSSVVESRLLTNELTAMISEFKATDPLNQILGLHVSDELHF